MDGEVVVGGVDLGVVEAGGLDPALEVVGNQDPADALEEPEHPHVGRGPVGEVLVKVGLGVGVGARAQDPDEEVGVADLAGFRSTTGIVGPA